MSRYASIAILLSFSLGFSGASRADEADAVAAEIKELKELFENGAGKNNDRALAAIRTAMASPKAAYELYMTSKKKLDFDDAGKSESAWRKWRDDNEDRYKDPSHLKARQYQLRYLALSIEASEAKNDEELAVVMPKLVSFLNDMTGVASEIGAHRRVLDESVLGSTYARRMKLDLTLDRKMAWEFAPLDVSGIYQTTILPYHRRAGDAAAIASAWEKRMLHEAKISTLPAPGVASSVPDIAGINPDDVQDLISRFRGGGRGRDREREDRREAERRRGQGEEAFRNQRLPELKWGKARDQLVFGSDRAGSLRAMAALFKANINHESARSWIEELSELSEQKTYDPEAIYGK